MLSFSGGALTAVVAPFGAELQSLQHGGRELLWQGGPAWPRRAPVLFPVVGRLAGDALTVDGESFTLGQHGFARDRTWDVVSSTDASCTLRLASDDETLERYPFAFALSVTYAVSGSTLSASFEVHNPAATSLPASLGAHPAFVWDHTPGATLTFQRPEPAPVRRLADGLLSPTSHPTPVDGRVLTLVPSLFEADAIILDSPASSSVRFDAPGAPSLTVAWSGFTELGLWSKPEAEFLCIEPWKGFADPEGFDGPFALKPGLMHLPPGQTRSLGWSVTVDG